MFAPTVAVALKKDPLGRTRSLKNTRPGPIKCLNPWRSTALPSGRHCSKTYRPTSANLQIWGTFYVLTIAFDYFYSFNQKETK
jgi:hypothetical protein